MSTQFSSISCFNIRDIFQSYRCWETASSTSSPRVFKHLVRNTYWAFRTLHSSALLKQPHSFGKSEGKVSCLSFFDYEKRRDWSLPQLTEEEMSVLLRTSKEVNFVTQSCCSCQRGLKRSLNLGIRSFVSSWSYTVFVQCFSSSTAMSARYFKPPFPVLVLAPETEGSGLELLWGTRLRASKESIYQAASILKLLKVRRM